MITGNHFIWVTLYLKNLSRYSSSKLMSCRYSLLSTYYCSLFVSLLVVFQIMVFLTVSVSKIVDCGAPVFKNCIMKSGLNLVYSGYWGLSVKIWSHSQLILNFFFQFLSVTFAVVCAVVAVSGDVSHLPEVKNQYASPSSTLAPVAYKAQYSPSPVVSNRGVIGKLTKKCLNV